MNFAVGSGLLTWGTAPADYCIVTEETSLPPKKMRLRYAGVCRTCGADLRAGEPALYFKATKQVACPSHDIAPVVECPSGVGPPATCAPPTSVSDEPVDIGVAGASARREHERRVARREAAVRASHPTLGGFLLAITDEPQSTRAWSVGARGEELLAKRLNGLVEQGVLVLHDRRIRGTKANIDHIAVSSVGVFVIDAKRYQGRPTRKVEGGILRARTETLMVGRRDCTKLLAGVIKQVKLVEAALAQMPAVDGLPVRGMLCFVEADWPLFGGSFTTGGVYILWPAKAAEKLSAPGPLTPDQTQAVHRHLARVFPVA